MSENNEQQSQREDEDERWNYAGANVPRLIEHCDKLLDYASNCGIKIADTIPVDIANARSAFARGKWTADHERKLYAAKSAMTNAIKPVTLHTLCDSTILEAKKITRFYFRLTFALVVLIVPASMIVFTDSSLSAKGKELIKENDQIALDLHNELQNYLISIEKEEPQVMPVPAASTTPTSVSLAKPSVHTSGMPRVSAAQGPQPGSADLTDPMLMLSVTPPALELKRKLQDFSRNNRQLYAETKWLIALTLHVNENVYESPWMLSGSTRRENLELSLPILNKPVATKSEDAINDGMQKLAVYQDIRAMAQNAQRTSDIFWGAVTTYLLPVLYSILGALAFILRELTEQNSKKTFYPSYARLANRLRLLTAVIVGTVIGLFDNALKAPGTVASASPLALAFFGGYAADTFFSFLNKAASQSREKCRDG
jgi:hypothetical protein